jgi:hypothetical protein
MALPLIARLVAGIGYRLSKDKPTPTLGKAPIKVTGRIKTSPSLKIKLEKALNRKVSRMMGYAHMSVKPLTPIDSGKARSSWRLTGKGKHSKLVNKVPYAKRLENGWSGQRPNGMLTQLISKIQRKFK